MAHEDITNLALRRMLYFPTAEIYGGLAGFWDFGPIGQRIRRKIVEFWRKELVEREGFVEISGSQILPEAAFKASGHLDNFNDPIVQCNKCKSLFRADNLIADHTKEIIPESMSTQELGNLIKKHEIKCTKCKSNDFSEVKKFNMMIKVDVGATGENVGYLRPETCQNIFLDFPRVFKAARETLPLGIAQVGSSFRNEIAPRNTLLRERELGQMEIEIFFDLDKINEIENWDSVENYKLNLLRLGKKEVEKVSCKEAVEKKLMSGKLIAYCLAKVQKLYEKYGFKIENMRFRELDKDERAFYAKETWDFEVQTSLGWVEIIACNYRTDYDLAGHSKGSKQDLSVNIEGKKIMPHVFEISAGVDRTLYAVLDACYRQEKRGSEERIFLDLPTAISPYTVAVFPLVKKDGLLEKGREVLELIEDYGFDAVFDEKASIGRRYARVDEIGVKYVITIDYDTMKDSTVTLRERTSMEQKRVKINDLPELLWRLSLGKAEFGTIK